MKEGYELTVFNEDSTEALEKHKTFETLNEAKSFIAARKYYKLEEVIFEVKEVTIIAEDDYIHEMIK